MRMRDRAPQPVYLKDYRPPAWTARHTALTFRLHPTATRVISRIRLAPGPETAALLAEGKPLPDLRLDGEKLTLIRAAINGAPLSPSDFILDETGLTVPAARLPAGEFTWEAEVEINPEANTALEGLYISRGMYCTQCEAEGFRRITYYPDRPDVMATFDVRIEGDETTPVMLSNGNPVARGEGWAEWRDPWPKPSYLFALVAGDLVAHRDRFTTRSGRKVDLAVWVRKGDENRCGYAMDALKRAMRWDEEVYGREYDLDVFNIVAVDDFNMGAMENKGLNIFNSKYVLASPETATDADYERIESIVAHEYFHNWTGNRITCRDWFQLSLKEGLTVFRDQQFSGDQRSHAVKRIEDVIALRARQFREDAGPLAHPVRPESYIEINNFYTATVYEKGAELIGMLRRLVGAEGYRKALDLYFERHDGQAATIEDWLKVFEDATGRDLSQFKLWYSQAGTPRLKITEDWDGETFTLRVEQQTPPTPGQPEKKPLHIPLALGLLNPSGDEVMPTTILELRSAREEFRIRGLSARPVPSILRGFSAPVIVERESTPEERAFLLAHDTDPFNKWEAGRALARDVLASMVREGAAPGPAYLDALERVARDESLDPAFRALAVQLPSDDDMAQWLFDHGTTPDPMAIRTARERLKLALARKLEPQLSALYESMRVPGPYTPDPKAAGCRALRSTALALMTRLDGGRTAERAFREADNMTETLSALSALLDIGKGEEQLAEFYRRWAHDRLVIDKWFALQIAHAQPLDAAVRAEELTRHPDFEWKNPNRFRAVFGALAGNAAGFHAPGGKAYELMADWLIRLDPVNPQTAARMTTAFETWRRYDAGRQAAMRAALERIAATPGLSRDTTEMVGRILAG
jgi:aminopeptidase N